jgi:hypothetical protein
MAMHVSELKGELLDLWVAKAVGWPFWMQDAWGDWHPMADSRNERQWRPRTDWCHCGPLIEEWKVELDFFFISPYSGEFDVWRAFAREPDYDSCGPPDWEGSGALEAICRAIVAGVYGEEVPQKA